MRKKLSQILASKDVWGSILKILLVIFTTLLIWVWADLSLDDVYMDSTSVLVIGSSEPDIWVRFKDDNSSEFSIDKVEFKGPALRIAGLRQDLEHGLFKLRFTLDPEQIKSESSEPVTVPLLAKLDNNTDIRKRGLKVVQCSPENVTILATKLVERELKLRCLDGSVIIKDARFEPETIKMLVPPTLSENNLVADVKFTSAAQATRAKSEFVEVRPEIRFAAGVAPRTADVMVKVRLPKEGGVGLVEKVLPGTIGVVGSAEMLEKFKVEILNAGEFTTTLQIKATEEAFAAYEGRPYKILLEVRAGDEKSETVSRKPEYNFPQEFVQQGEIEAVNELYVAKFKLTPKNGVSQ